MRKYYQHLTPKILVKAYLSIFKNIWHNKTWIQIREEIQTELYGDEWYILKIERQRRILDRFHIGYTPVLDEAALSNYNTGLKRIKDIDKSCKLLDTRKKSQRLTQQEKLYIFTLFQEGNTNKRHIMQNYNISRGTFNNICSELWSTWLEQ